VPVPEPPPEGFIQVPAVWVGVEEMPVHFVNQIVGVVHPGEIFFTLGSLVPPPIIGATVEERKAQAESFQFIQVTPVVRFALTPQKLQEFIGVFQQTLANYERLQGS
jgi:hypothetical protein